MHPDHQSVSSSKPFGGAERPPKYAVASAAISSVWVVSCAVVLAQAGHPRPHWRQVRLPPSSLVDVPKHVPCGSVWMCRLASPSRSPYVLVNCPSLSTNEGRARMTPSSRTRALHSNSYWEPWSGHQRASSWMVPVTVLPHSFVEMSLVTMQRADSRVGHVFKRAAKTCAPALVRE